MSNLIKLDLILDQSKKEDMLAYDKLKLAANGAERKALLLSFVRTEQVHTLTSRLLRLTAILISFILVSLSIHFTYSFNSLAMPRLWAFLLSLSLVSFVSLALTFATYSSKSSALVFKFLWVLGLSYSIFNAFAGQYNSFRSYVSVEVSTDSASQVDLLKEEKLQLLSQITELKQKQVPYENLISDLSSSPEKKVEYPQTWRDANYNFNRLEERIVKAQSRVSEINSLLLQLSTTSSSSIESTTVYTWLSRVIHIPANTIQFIILILPSLFIDIASSLLLRYALGFRSQSIKENSPRS